MNMFYFLLLCLSLSLNFGVVAQEIELDENDTKPSNPFSLEHQEGNKLISITLDSDSNTSESDISFGDIGVYSLGISSTGGRVAPEPPANRPSRPSRSVNRDSSYANRAYDAKACKDLNKLDLLYAFLTPQLKAGNLCFMQLSKNTSTENGFCTNQSGQRLMNFSVYYSDLIIPENEKLKCKKVVHISLSQ